MNVIAYDPFYKPASGMEAVRCLPWPQGLGEADFIVFTCALTPQNRHMFNEETIDHMKVGRHAVIAAGAVVIEEVPDNVLVVGVPAKIQPSVALQNDAA